MQKIIVTEKPESWDINSEEVKIISPDDYILSPDYSGVKNIKLINLCKTYQYQSMGYYISLLAQARGHNVLPDISAMMDFKVPELIRDDAQDFDEIIQKTLGNESSSEVEVHIFFGLTNDVATGKLGLLLFNLYPVPILKVNFVKKTKWQLTQLKPLNLKDLEPSLVPVMVEALDQYLSGKKIRNRNYKRKKFDLAILVNPDDPNPPSNENALIKFVKAAEKAGFNTDLITKSDFNKLNHFDALFIRDTTNVNHYTFRFSRKAQYEGMAVIDDPYSILRCTNKVYLNELMQTHQVPTPKTILIHKNDLKKPLEGLNFPCVLKLPDGAFSKGVKKVGNESEMKEHLQQFFQKSDLVIAQEFMPTPFDWRVGVLNGKPIYVCKYFMARNHWQIVNWKGENIARQGKSESLPISEVPPKIIKLALKATSLIGKGLYGVDIKEYKRKYYVIEVNDNPSIDSGIEDKVEKNKLYEVIMDHLMSLVVNK